MSEGDVGLEFLGRSPRHDLAEGQHHAFVGDPHGSPDVTDRWRGFPQPLLDDEVALEAGGARPSSERGYEARGPSPTVER